MRRSPLSVSEAPRRAASPAPVSPAPNCGRCGEYAIIRRVSALALTPR